MEKEFLKSLKQKFIDFNWRSKEIVRYIYHSHVKEDQYENVLKKWYEKRTGEELDLENPKSFSQKIQWIKLNYKDPRMTTLADKYLVRDYIKEKIGEEYLIPLIGVYDRFDDIDFDTFPEKFVLKANHGSGYNFIVEDKNKFDKKKARKCFKKWLKINHAYRLGFEMQYRDIKPRIVAEEYIKDGDDLYDYKILVLGGKSRYIWVDSGRYTSHHRNVYELNWESAPFKINRYLPNEGLKRPVNLEKMISFAEVLAADFPEVRVDFYEVNGKLYFGEMTFTSESGVAKITPHEYDLKLGSMIPVP